MNEKIIKIGKEIVPYILVILLAVVIRTFIVSPVRVNGSSMYDTLKNGEILLLNKTNKNYKRFDIVVINKNGSKLIKRIIGLPGESIEYKNNSLYINNKYVKDVSKEVTADFSLEELYNYKIIPEGYYFVMGDNRNHSSDSRDIKYVGLIKKSEIKGKAMFRVWPLNRFGKVK
jgi:signal peptidase I